MPDVVIRKIITSIEEIFHEGGPRANSPHKRGYIMAVIHNPYAGEYVEDIQPFMEDLKPLGFTLADRLLEEMGGDASMIKGYGKGAIIGTGGEIEHGALWHAPGGYVMREVIGGSKAIVPSTKKVGCAGTRLDVPITHVNASYVRSHLDAIEVGINDAPRQNEMALILAMTSGERVHNRAGGLDAKDIKGEDGLR